MKKVEVLSMAQRQLVEKNLSIVRWAIYMHIQVNETVVGLSHDDLFQEGCIWLCKAATTYNGKTARFETYAKVVVKNGLTNYCRNLCAKFGKQLPLQELIDPCDKDSDTFLNLLAVEDFSDSTLSEIAVISLLESVKSEYSGVARLGIEALELKVRGFSGKEIACFYGVAQNHVGAWVSRATGKLRQNDRFLLDLQRYVS